MILQIYADYNKHLGAYKITYVLKHNHGINISVGRVYRLIRTLDLPRMSTDKPYKNYHHKDTGLCADHLQQEFNQKSPNIVWTSDFTYIKVANKWYYLCIVMNLFSRKMIAWNHPLIMLAAKISSNFSKGRSEQKNISLFAGIVAIHI